MINCKVEKMFPSLIFFFFFNLLNQEESFTQNKMGHSRVQRMFLKVMARVVITLKAIKLID